MYDWILHLKVQIPARTRKVPSLVDNLAPQARFPTYMSRLMTKSSKWHMCPAKTQISLGIRPVRSESSLSAWRKLGSSATHWAHREDPDQTGRMPRLILVFTGSTDHFGGFVMRWLTYTCILFSASNDNNNDNDNNTWFYNSAWFSNGTDSNNDSHEPTMLCRYRLFSGEHLLSQFLVRV